MTAATDFGDGLRVGDLGTEPAELLGTGFHLNVPEADYHADRSSLSQSGAKTSSSMSWKRFRLSGAQPA